MKENHRGAVHGEEPIEGLRRDKGVIRNGELHAHQQGFKSCNDEKQQRITDVHQPKALVVDGRHPAMQHFKPETRT